MVAAIQVEQTLAGWPDPFVVETHFDYLMVDAKAWGDLFGNVLPHAFNIAPVGIEFFGFGLIAVVFFFQDIDWY